MNDTFNKEKALNLKNAIKSPEASRILLNAGLTQVELENHIDALSNFATSGPAAVSGYFPNILREPNFKPPLGTKKPTLSRNLDIDPFANDLHNELKDLAISGYTLRARRDGNTVYTLVWNWARRLA